MFTFEKVVKLIEKIYYYYLSLSHVVIEPFTRFKLWNVPVNCTKVLAYLISSVPTIREPYCMEISKI